MDSYGSYIAAGFDLLYDKSGFYDSVRSIMTASDTARRLTWNWQRIGPGQSHMLNFLENHDEQRFASVHYASIPEKAFAAMAVACLSASRRRKNASYAKYTPICAPAIK